MLHRNFGKSWHSWLKKYERYDGFVILHGTDTITYTASALSFMLQNLGKPVILTGSQLPVGVIRTDARRNLITSIEIASSDRIIPEVCIYFSNQLYRGNRAEKYTSVSLMLFNRVIIRLWPMQVSTLSSTMILSVAGPGRNSTDKEDLIQISRCWKSIREFIRMSLILLFVLPG